MLLLKNDSLPPHVDVIFKGALGLACLRLEYSGRHVGWLDVEKLWQKDAGIRVMNRS